MRQYNRKATRRLPTQTSCNVPTLVETHITGRLKIKSLNAIQLPSRWAWVNVSLTFSSTAPKKNRLQRGDPERLQADISLRRSRVYELLSTLFCFILTARLG
jgi:hypothetical protein